MPACQFWRTQTRRERICGEREEASAVAPGEEQATGLAVAAWTAATAAATAAAEAAEAAEAAAEAEAAAHKNVFREFSPPS